MGGVRGDHRVAHPPRALLSAPLAQERWQVAHEVEDTEPAVAIVAVDQRAQGCGQHTGEEQSGAAFAGREAATEQRHVDATEHSQFDGVAVSAAGERLGDDLICPRTGDRYAVNSDGQLEALGETCGLKNEVDCFADCHEESSNCFICDSYWPTFFNLESKCFYD